MIMRVKSEDHAWLMDALSRRKKHLMACLARRESLLTQVDGHMHQGRINLCNLLRYIGDGIESRELSIKEQLKSISKFEMLKGKEEDALQEQTLKTIEVINIADI
jgi:hypothetical protein